MRKSILLFTIFICVSVSAQNFQVHYDLGKERNYVTTTFELFKLDKLGNTFIFVDFDYSLDKEKHPSLAYMEVARCFTLGKTPLSVQVEYNGGFLVGGKSSADPAFPINNAYLGGLDYGWHSQDFSKFLNFKVLYKNIAGKHPASFQLTGVWTLNFFENKLTLSGFADFWREDNTNFVKPNGDALAVPTNTKYVFISEPQFWYNITPNLSLGSEVELSTNFGQVDGFKICPTLGAKWTF